MPQHLRTVAIDLGKKVFHLVGSDTAGTICWRKRLTRQTLMPFIAQLPPVRIGLEACGGAHDWARRFREQGHEVKLMAPQFVKPFVKSNKNDMRDAEAIAEAVTRPTMRFVPTQDIAQQDLQALHRVRERLIGERTALVNEVHGLMHEYGLVLAKGRRSSGKPWWKNSRLTRTSSRHAARRCVANSWRSLPPWRSRSRIIRRSSRAWPRRIQRVSG